MGSKKVEEKLQTLIHAFYEQKELSAKTSRTFLSAIGLALTTT